MRSPRNFALLPRVSLFRSNVLLVNEHLLCRNLVVHFIFSPFFTTAGTGRSSRSTRVRSFHLNLLLLELNFRHL